jgi:hypothetical protein
MTALCQQLFGRALARPVRGDKWIGSPARTLLTIPRLTVIRVGIGQIGGDISEAPLITSHFSRDEQALVTTPPGLKSVPGPPVDLAW